MRQIHVPDMKEMLELLNITMDNNGNKVNVLDAELEKLVVAQTQISHMLEQNAYNQHVLETILLMQMEIV